MPGVITTGSHPKALWPGVKAWYGTTYDEHQEEYTDLFDVQTTERAYEELVETTNFGLMSVKRQGAAITYDTDSQGSVSRFTAVTYASGYIVTYEENADNQYEVVSKRRAKKLAFSARQTVENVAAAVYNRAFTAGYTGGDGSTMIASDHTSRNGNQSNLLTTAADLSEASLEDLVVQIMDTTDNVGNRISVMPESLIVPTAKWFESNRILNSTLQNNTANNAVNALRFTGTFPKGIKVNHYLGSTTAFFIRTNVKDSMIFMWRERPELFQDQDGDTRNLKAAIIARFVASWADWRGVFGTPGV